MPPLLFYGGLRARSRTSCRPTPPSCRFGFAFSSIELNWTKRVIVLREVRRWETWIKSRKGGYTRSECFAARISDCSESGVILPFCTGFSTSFLARLGRFGRYIRVSDGWTWNASFSSPTDVTSNNLKQELPRIHKISPRDLPDVSCTRPIRNFSLWVARIGDRLSYLLRKHRNAIKQSTTLD